MFLRGTNEKYFINNHNEIITNSLIKHVKISVDNCKCATIFKNSIIKFLKFPTLMLLKNSVIFMNNCRKIEWVSVKNVNNLNDHIEFIMVASSNIYLERK